MHKQSDNWQARLTFADFSGPPPQTKDKKHIGSDGEYSIASDDSDDIYCRTQIIKTKGRIRV